MGEFHPLRPTRRPRGVWQQRHVVIRAFDHRRLARHVPETNGFYRVGIVAVIIARGLTGETTPARKAPITQVRYFGQFGR